MIIVRLVFNILMNLTLRLIDYYLSVATRWVRSLGRDPERVRCDGGELGKTIESQ